MSDLTPRQQLVVLLSEMSRRFQEAAIAVGLDKDEEALRKIEQGLMTHNRLLTLGGVVLGKRAGQRIFDCLE